MGAGDRLTEADLVVAAGPVRRRRGARRLLHRRRRAAGRPPADPGHRRRRAAAPRLGRVDHADRPARAADRGRPGAGAAVGRRRRRRRRLPGRARPAPGGERQAASDGPGARAASPSSTRRGSRSRSARPAQRQLVLAVPEAGGRRFFAALAAVRRAGADRGPPRVAGTARGRRTDRSPPGPAGSRRRSRCSRRRSDVVVLKRCVDVDDLLATAASGQADVAVLGLDAPGLDARRGGPAPPRRGAPGGGGTGRRPAGGRRASGPPGSASAPWSPTTTSTSLPDAVVAADVAPRPPGRRRSRGRRTAASRRLGGGRVVAVWGPAGAPGRTTVATGLAAELARRAAAHDPGRRRPVRRQRGPGARDPRRGLRAARGHPAGGAGAAWRSGSPRCSAGSTPG